MEDAVEGEVIRIMELATEGGDDVGRVLARPQLLEHIADLVVGEGAEDAEELGGVLVRLCCRLVEQLHAGRDGV